MGLRDVVVYFVLYVQVQEEKRIGYKFGLWKGRFI